MIILVNSALTVRLSGFVDNKKPAEAGYIILFPSAVNIR